MYFISTLLIPVMSCDLKIDNNNNNVFTQPVLCWRAR